MRTVLQSLERFRPRGALWRHPDFLRLWGAQIGSAFGSRITRTALPMIAILSIGATPTEVAILSALGVAPGVIVGLFVGGTVDRSRKRPLLIGADLTRAALILTVPAAAWLGVLTVPQLYIVAAAIGAATTLFQIADNAYLPTLIGKEHLLDGNAKLEATDAVAEAAGPGVAGVLIQVLTAPFAMVVDALTYLWSAWLLGRIRAPEKAAAEPSETSTLHDIVTGVRACLAEPLIAPLLVAETILSFFGGFFLALYMIVALETLGLSPASVGLIISVGGIGAFAGATLAKPLARLAGTGRAMVIALAVGQASALLIPLSLQVPSGLTIPLLLVHQLVGDAFVTAFVVHMISLRQRTLPHDVLGRANATFHVATGLMLAVGALVAGPLAGAIGVMPAMWIGALGGLLVVPVLLASPLRRLR